VAILAVAQASAGVEVATLGVRNRFNLRTTVVLRVQEVAPDSLGAELGLRVGTELLSINERSLEDFLDWEFLTADETFVLRARLPGGEELEYDIERPEGMPLGVVLEPPRIRRCANHCDFCFVDGNPAGMRSALYIRDDDYRLSFRYGNFATLTNLKPRDEARIVEYRLSPLYVSVHATDPVVRRWLLRNPEAPEIVPQLRQFGERGIRFHTQIVLVPGVNDGRQLAATLQDLYVLGAAVLSVSVVPVALTEFSKHRLVRPPRPDECRSALAIVDQWATRSVAERGHPWCFGADDLYLRAGVPLPAAAWYGDFEQRENGVGAVRYLQTRIAAARGGYGDWRGKRIAVVTGTAMAPLLPQVLAVLETETGASFEVVAVENSLFGPSVTTAGLLPGAALQQALAARSEVDLALLPAESVNDDLRFIDDLEAHDLAGRVPVEIRFSHDFADALSDGWKDGPMGGLRVDAQPAPSTDPTLRPSAGEGRG
jgi:putative radical SAM enzyme (TIGR03279 family)